MNLLNSTRRKPFSDRPRLLFFSLLLSLILHLLVVMPLFQQQNKPQLWQQQPTIVRLVDMPAKIKKPQQEKPNIYEIDQQPVKPQPEAPVESFRKADRDQRVDREQAPKGEDVRDQTAKPLRPTLPTVTKQSIQEKPTLQERQTTDIKAPQPVLEKKLKKIAEKTSPPITAKPAQPKTPPPSISLEQLQPDTSTLDRIARGSQGTRQRTKERKDVEIGDTVWLNLQHNLLVSFFRRFHDKIELVWNYPTEAAKNGIEGILELLIIVNQKGDLLDVDLLQTSGSDLLDFEAIQAIYRAAPFGPLTQHYPHETLKIRAYFSYQISGRYIYGR